MSALKKILIVVVIASLLFCANCRMIRGGVSNTIDIGEGIEALLIPVEKKLDQDRTDRASRRVKDRQDIGNRR